MKTPPWVDRAEYPFESRFVRLRDGCMHVVDSGPLSSRPALLFLHGNPTWSFSYRRSIARLSEEFRCIAPDWLGFGLSDNPPQFGYRPQDHARSLTSLIARLDPGEIVLVAHDWGGPIGLSVALDQPSRIGGVVLSNTWLWPPLDLRTSAFARLAKSLPGRIAIRNINILVHLMPLAFGKPSRLSRIARWHYRHAQLGRSDGPANLPPAFLSSASWMNELRQRSNALADVPKSIVWGMRDPVIRPRNLERWREIYPEMHVLELEDVGHFVPEEAPDRVTVAIRFVLTHMGSGSAIRGES